MIFFALKSEKLPGPGPKSGHRTTKMISLALADRGKVFFSPFFGSAPTESGRTLTNRARPRATTLRPSKIRRSSLQWPTWGGELMAGRHDFQFHDRPQFRRPHGKRPFCINEPIRLEKKITGPRHFDKKMIALRAILLYGGNSSFPGNARWGESDSETHEGSNSTAPDPGLCYLSVTVCFPHITSFCRSIELFARRRMLVRQIHIFECRRRVFFFSQRSSYTNGVFPMNGEWPVMKLKIEMGLANLRLASDGVDGSCSFASRARPTVVRFFPAFCPAPERRETFRGR